MGQTEGRPKSQKRSVPDILAKTKLIKQLVLVVAIGGILRFGLKNLGWHPPSFEKRLIPALVLWVIFSLYWGIAGLNSAPTKSSESWASTSFHQFMLGVALLLLILTVPGLNGRFLPERLHFLVVAGAIVQAGFLLLAVWARRHLGRNWSAEVRIAMDHQLIRTGPYRFLRHLSTRRCSACSWERRSLPARFMRSSGWRYWWWHTCEKRGWKIRS